MNKTTRRTKRPGKPAVTVVTGRQIKLGTLVFDVEPIAVASARTGMPGLIRASAETGRAFLIRNAKNASAATALLINPEVLERRLVAMKPRRSLGELIDTLPFKRHGAPRLVASPLDDDAPTLRVPGRRAAKDTQVEAAQRLERNGTLYGPEAETGA